jgi:hypothetical protein
MKNYIDLFSSFGGQRLVPIQRFRLINPDKSGFFGSIATTLPDNERLKLHRDS